MEKKLKINTISFLQYIHQYVFIRIFTVKFVLLNLILSHLFYFSNLFRYYQIDEF